MSVPTAPQIEVRPLCSDQEITFFWQPPTSDGGSPILHYTLACPEIPYTQDISANVPFFRVTGLTNQVDYTFTLTATNSIGTGPAATYRTVQTGTTPFGPTLATVSTLNISTAFLSWNLSTIANEAEPKWIVIKAYPSSLAMSSFKQTQYATKTSSCVESLSTNTYYQFLVQSVNDVGYCTPFAFTSSLFFGTEPFSAATSLLSHARALAAGFSTDVSPVQNVSPLTINGELVGNYEYTVKSSSTTISSFTASDYFTSTADTNSSWIIVKGDLTVNAGQTVIPPVRKLFTVVYVTGNLTVNGSISMTARGANHSGTGVSGGYTAPVNIRIGTGTFSAITNPQIPATGGAGASRRTTSGQNLGTAGSNGGTGGGGGGYFFGSQTVGWAGAGAAGTCFSGGAGSGGAYNSTNTVSVYGEDGGANGGAGGAGAGDQIAPGGSGNPFGQGYYFSAPDSRANGGEGTGGTLIVICEGTLQGSGSISAQGVATNNFSGITGGGSGGGSLTTLFGSNPGNAVSLIVSGGGSGGAGTARRLAIGGN